MVYISHSISFLRLFNRYLPLNIFLTGATGFIGSQLVKRLIKSGHSVDVVVRASSNLDVLKEVLPKIRVHIYDGNYESLRHALKVSNPELVCHVASLFLAKHKSEDVTRLVQSNLTFPLQLLEAMNTLGIKKFLNTGTSWQHFNDDDYNPVNLYAATKNAFESLLRYYLEAEGLSAITLKLFDTYGPGDMRPKLFSLLRRATSTGIPLSMSPGQQLLDLVYIDDVLDAYLRSMAIIKDIRGHESFAVGSSYRISLRELVKIYGEIVGRPVPVEWGRQAYRFREVLIPWNGDCLPGWGAKISLHEGIRMMEMDPTVDGLLSDIKAHKLNNLGK